MKENRAKFYTFCIVVRCTLDNDDISFSVDGNEVDVPLYGFDDCEWVCYRYCKIKKLRDYIFHRAMMRNNKLVSSFIISNVLITLFSNYNSMTAKHKLVQPRRVLESNLLKHIKNASYDDKIFKYNFLSLEYKLLF